MFDTVQMIKPFMQNFRPCVPILFAKGHQDQEGNYGYCCLGGWLNARERVEAQPQSGKTLGLKCDHLILLRFFLSRCSS
jgi:hypothetical protein